MDLGSSNVLSQVLTLLLSEKSGLGIGDGNKDMQDLEKLTASLVERFQEDSPARTDNPSAAGGK
jgi:hypothetical protein